MAERKQTMFFEEYLPTGDRSLVLNADCIGQEIPFTLWNHQMMLCFPNFSNDTGSARWKLTTDGTKLKLNWDERWNRAGRVTGWNSDTNDILEFKTDVIIMRSANPLSEDEATELQRISEDWLDSFLTSIELTKFIDLSAPRAEVNGGIVDAYLVSSDQAPRPVGATKRGITIKSLSSIKKDELVAAIDHMENSYTFDAEYFLLDALRALNRQRYRGCLIDSATAVELALSDLLLMKLEGLSDAHKKLITNKYNMLDRLRDALKILGTSTPHEIISDVATPRNDAVHRGISPTEGQAKRALDAAKRFIDQYLLAT